MRRPLPTSALSVAPALLSVPPRRCGMKFLHAALLGAALIAAPVADVLAQGSSSSSSLPSAPATKDPSPAPAAGTSASGTITTPGGLLAAGRDGGRTAIASTSTRSSGRTSPLTTSNVFGG